MLSIETNTVHAFDLMVTLSKEMEQISSCGLDHCTSMAFRFEWVETDKSLVLILHLGSLSLTSHQLCASTSFPLHTWLGKFLPTLF